MPSTFRAAVRSGMQRATNCPGKATSPAAPLENGLFRADIVGAFPSQRKASRQSVARLEKSLRSLPGTRWRARQRGIVLALRHAAAPRPRSAFRRPVTLVLHADIFVPPKANAPALPHSVSERARPVDFEVGGQTEVRRQIGDAANCAAVHDAQSLLFDRHMSFGGCAMRHREVIDEDAVVFPIFVGDGVSIRS